MPRAGNCRAIEGRNRFLNEKGELGTAPREEDRSLASKHMACLEEGLAPWKVRALLGHAQCCD